MFKFLKIRTSDSGDARRHVPFGSIIHKHVLPLFLSLVLVLFSSAQSVYAVDVPLPPVWLPMNPYNSDALHNNYVLLNDDQKKIVNEVMGVYGSVFLGLAANPLQNPIQTVSNARKWLQEYGSTFLNAIFDSTVQSPRAITDLVGSVTYKASQYESYSDYENDTDPTVSSGLEKYIQFTPELTVAYKNWFAVNGNVYNWQVQVKPFDTNVLWNTYSGGVQAASTYWTYLSELNNPRVRINNSDTFNNYIYSYDFLDYHYIFVNTTTGKVGLCNSSGEYLNGVFHYDRVWYNGTNGVKQFNTYLNGMNFSYSYDQSSSNFVQVIRDYYNHQFGYWFFFFRDFVTNCYVGANWNSKEEIYNIDDLNIGASPSAYIDNVGDDAFVNINGLIGYIGSDVTDVREGVFENTLVRDGDHAVELTDSILKAIDRAVEETKSGIIVPTDVFSTLFDDGKGFISYMWYMTKPLVIYTRDLLDLLTFDPVNGFNASGPGYFVLGVVGLGVIGGVIVKFLL